MWVDHCQCRIPGRRKIFHLIGVVLMSCSFFFIWHDCFTCTTAPAPYKVLYYVSFAVVFQFAWACVQISQLSFIPELTSDKNEQVALNSIRYAFTIVANIMVFGCFWGLLEHFNHGDANDLNPNDKKIFWIMALVVLVVGVPVTVMFQFFVPEKSQYVENQGQKWYKWFCNPMFYLTALCLVAARFIVLLPQTFMPSYFLTTLNMDKSSIAKGPLILFISSFCGTFVIKKISKMVGDKMAYFIGLAIVWAALIWFWIKDCESSEASMGHFNFRRDEIYGATILLGFGGAAVLVISLSKISHLVGNYTGSSGFVYGWMLFLDRLTNGLAVKIILSFQPKDLQQLPDYHRRVLIFPPFAGSALGLLIISLMFVIDWRQTRKKNTKMIHDLVRNGGHVQAQEHHTE